MNAIVMNIGAALRERRLALGLTQTSIARSSSMSKQHLHRIETGNRHCNDIGVITLTRVCGALRWTPQEALEAAFRRFAEVNP